MNNNIRKGDWVRSTHRNEIGVVLGFGIDFLIHRYDTPQYRVLWRSGSISKNVSKDYLRKIA